MPTFRRNWYAALLVVAGTWFAHFSHFTRFGLYADDWYYVGYPFSLTARQWLGNSLWNQFTNPQASQGRPLQFLICFVLTELGALTGSLAVNYLTAFAVSAGTSLFMFHLLRKRFSRQISALATLLFVVSPLHTLHQCVLYPYSLGSSFSLVFFAMLLYPGRRRAYSYAVAALSLLTYESVFFLFLAAPLIRRGRMFQGRRREWLIHIAVCAVIVMAYFLARLLTAEARVNALPHGAELLRLILTAWIVYTASSFAPYYYAAIRAFHDAPDEGWACAVLCATLVTVMLYLYRRHRPATGWKRSLVLACVLRPAFVGFAFLTLGYVVAYFVLLEPHARLPYTDRGTRASMAASFGSSVLVAVILGSLIRFARTAQAQARRSLLASAFVGILFLYSLVLQNDYVRDWEMQGETARQFMALTPDVHEDSILVLRFPGVDPGLAGQPAIGADQDGYDEVIQHIYNRSQKLPKLFIVVSDDWPKYLKPTPDGFLEWKAPFFPGRWYPSTGRYRPGHFIVLDEQRRGHMVRRNDPVLVDGVDIVQHAPAAAPPQTLWTSAQTTPLHHKLLAR